MSTSVTSSWGFFRSWRQIAQRLLWFVVRLGGGFTKSLICDGPRCSCRLRPKITIFGSCLWISILTRASIPNGHTQELPQVHPADTKNRNKRKKGDLSPREKRRKKKESGGEKGKGKIGNRRTGRRKKKWPRACFWETNTTKKKGGIMAPFLAKRAKVCLAGKGGHCRRFKARSCRKKLN